MHTDTNGDVQRSILWVHPVTQGALATLFVIACTGFIVWWDPQGWGWARTIAAGTLAGISCYFCLFNNRIIVTYFGDLPDGGGSDR
jgi:hypothetical protein